MRTETVNSPIAFLRGAVQSGDLEWVKQYLLVSTISPNHITEEDLKQLKLTEQKNQAVNYNNRNAPTLDTYNLYRAQPAFIFNDICLIILEAALLKTTQNGIKTIRLLSKSRFNPSCVSINESNPFWLAAWNGHLEIVQFFLNRFEVNAPRSTVYKGSTAFYVACQEGHLDIVEWLLTEGADINLGDNDNTSPLYIACQEGHLNIVTFLLEQPNININQARNTGVTPLYMACLKGHTAIVQLLGARQDVDVDAVGLKGHTPLLVACLSPLTQGKIKLFQSLLSKNPDLKKLNDQGKTALDIAISNHENEKNQVAIDAILKHVFNSNIDIRQITSKETFQKLFHSTGCRLFLFGHKDNNSPLFRLSKEIITVIAKEAYEISSPTEEGKHTTLRPNVSDHSTASFNP